MGVISSPFGSSIIWTQHVGRALLAYLGGGFTYISHLFSRQALIGGGQKGVTGACPGQQRRLSRKYDLETNREIHSQNSDCDSESGFVCVLTRYFPFFYLISDLFVCCSERDYDFGPELVTLKIAIAGFLPMLARSIIYRTE